MNNFSRKRPTFDQFRNWFIEEIHSQTSLEKIDTYMTWANLGSDELRESIVESFMEMLESRFGFRPVFQENLSTMEGSLESVAMRIFHVFSTMFLVDHINEKMYKERENKLH